MSYYALRCFDKEVPAQTRGYLIFLESKRVDAFLLYANSSVTDKYKAPGSKSDGYEKMGEVVLSEFLQSQVNAKKCFFVGSLPDSAFIEKTL